MASRPLKQPRVLAFNLAEVQPGIVSSLDGADACREDTCFVTRILDVACELVTSGVPPMHVEKWLAQRATEAGR